MGKGWKELLQGESGGKDKQKLIIMILCGVLLFMIASPANGNGFLPGQKASNPSTHGIASGGTKENVTEQIQAQVGYGNNPQKYTTEYIADLEKRLAERLSKIYGVGAVEVMISVTATEELVVEKEQSSQKNTTSEADAGGGKRTVSEQTTQENTVYASNGSEKHPVVVKTILPKVQGVLVVAKGAGAGNVNRTIVEIVQALFGLEAHKVKVVKME